MTTRIVVLGGYGNFGAVIARALSDDSNIELYVAGRNSEKAAEFAKLIGARAATLDSNGLNFSQKLERLNATILINTAGPFQNADYSVAKACIAVGCHYIDIADGRQFVCRITSLDDAAKRAGVITISGASTVPALSSAVVDAHVARFSALLSIKTGISASEKIPGEATIAAVLSYAGKKIDIWRDGKLQTVYGWQDLRLKKFATPVGWRWQCNCDVPDLSLFPNNYPDTETVVFSAGLGMTATHIGTWILAGLTRAGLIRQPDRLSALLRRLALRLARFGNGKSAMFVAMTGRDHDGKKIQWRWELIAQNNDGINVPCLGAVALARKLVNQSAASDALQPGAYPCVGFVSLEEYLAALAGLQITTSLTEIDC